MLRHCTLLSLSCALLVTFTAREPTLALEGSKVFTAHPHIVVVNIGGRKGTRLYRPDDSEPYDDMVEGEDKTTATHQPTVEERLEECMASWDDKTHITKTSWRLICERQIKDNE